MDAAEKPPALPVTVEQLDAVLAPLREARTLPPSVYRVPAVLSTEHAELLAKSWLCVGREADLREPGSYLRARLEPLSPAGVLVTRAADGTLRAFHNVCRHRAALLVQDDSGQVERFRCPYHGWTYRLDGALESAPHTGGLCEFDRDAHALAPVRVDTLLGFVFICLDAEAPTLAEALAPLPEHFQKADIASLRCARRVEWETQANWKLLIENYQESHHFPQVHPELESHTPFARSGSFFDDDSPWLGGLMDLEGDAETVSMTGKLRGRARIAGAPERRVVDCMLYPLLLTSLQPDYLLTYRLWPVAPDRTRVVFEILVPEATLDDGAPLDDVFEFWDITNRQDKEICESQQRGLSSPGSERGRYATVEDGMHAFDQRVARFYKQILEPEQKPAELWGIWGQPYIDLSPLIDTSQFDELHEEITYALCSLPTSYTGGSLKWLDVAAPWVRDDEYADLGDVIEGMSGSEWQRFVSLADDPTRFELSRRWEYEFGDETDHPLSRRQMLFLKYRHGVYFPWQVVYHLLENDRWEDKHSGRGKQFAPEAREHLPKTLAFIQSLPFREIGRCLIFGLEANDHATLHRDSEPGRELSVAQSITFCPAGNKRFYLCSPEGEAVTFVESRIYWFNDMDYHGVEHDPFFRYSVRVDGVFEPDFLRRLQRSLGR